MEGMEYAKVQNQEYWNRKFKNILTVTDANNQSNDRKSVRNDATNQLKMVFPGFKADATFFKIGVEIYGCGREKRFCKLADKKWIGNVHQFCICTYVTLILL